MKYESATWHIRVARGQFVEISVRGNVNDREAPSTPRDVLHAASVLKEVGRAMERIAARWELVERVEEK